MTGPQWIYPELDVQSPFLEVTGAEFQEAFKGQNLTFDFVPNPYLVEIQAILINGRLNVSTDVYSCLLDPDTANETFNGLMIAILKEDILTSGVLAVFLKYHP